MNEKAERSRAAGLLMTVASFVIIVAGMRAATAILVPFLLSLFVAIVCTPLLFGMRRKGVPNALAVVAILVGIMTVGLLLSSFLRTSLNDFTSALPGYQARLSLKATAFLAWLKDLGLDVPDQILISDLNPSKAMTVAAGALASLSSILTNVFLILLTVVFILLEASGVPQKVQAAFGNPERPIAWMHEFTESLNRYLAIKTLFSLLTGLAVWVWLVFLGVDYPFLWGLLGLYAELRAEYRFHYCCASCGALDADSAGIKPCLVGLPGLFRHQCHHRQCP